MEFQSRLRADFCSRHFYRQPITFWDRHVGFFRNVDQLVESWTILSLIVVAHQWIRVSDDFKKYALVTRFYHKARWKDVRNGLRTYPRKIWDWAVWKLFGMLTLLRVGKSVSGEVVFSNVSSSESLVIVSWNSGSKLSSLSGVSSLPAVVMRVYLKTTWRQASGGGHRVSDGACWWNFYHLSWGNSAWIVTLA